MQHTTDDVIQLRAGGVSVIVQLCAPVPRVLHWGAELGELDEAALADLAATATPSQLNNAIDVPRLFSLWPTEAEGWSGTPAHTGHRAGTGTTPRPRLVDSSVLRRDDSQELVVELVDDISDLDIQIHYRLSAEGILAVESTLTGRSGSAGSASYDLSTVSTLLPVPSRAAEVLDFTGKWCRERAPQRRPLGFGSYVRDCRRGKPGHDSPYLLALGTPGFGFRSGEVWAVHVAWSGNQRYLAERHPEGAGVHGAVLGGGELLTPGEIRLAAGETYRSPVLYFAWSDTGLDGISDRFHRMLRRRPGHPRSPRPLLLNTWEAVYFDHDLSRLIELADRAAAVGVELLVLDDGWFTGRRDDTAGLGDWAVDEAVWPDGLAPLVDHVRGLGMRFGLWFEPEMINLDSHTAREHPDWILGPSTGLGPTSRNQYVLNLANDQAWQHLLKRIDTLVTQYSIDFLKWDHNRDLHEAALRSPGNVNQADRPGAHAQTAALYRLLDALRERHPELEIESCSSGGGRVDLGVLDRTDRVWASDCNDPVERQSIQRWTGQLLPPELIGSHVGPSRAHTTHRITDMSFQLTTSLFGHAGIERDLTSCNDEELASFTAWAAMYREFRPLLHTGTVVRADLEDEQTLLHGVVAANQSSALFCWARLATSAAGQSGRVRLPGLDAQRSYRLRIRSELGLPATHEVAPPGWLNAAMQDWLTLPGAVLVTAGLPMPTLNPAQALLIEIAPVATA